MLVTALAKIILGLLGFIFVFNLPAFPESIITVFNSVMGYLGDGIDVLHVFLGNTCMTVIGSALALVLVANGVYFTVSFLFFVLKKIPFLGLKE